VLDKCHDSAGHEPGRSHGLARTRYLDDFDHTAAGRDVDPATGAGGDDLVRARAVVRRHDDFHAVTFHSRSVLRLRSLPSHSSIDADGTLCWSIRWRIDSLSVTSVSTILPMSDPNDALPEFRASDAEREQAADVLRVAASEGRLNVDELEDRLGSVYNTRTRPELDRLIADVNPDRLRHGQANAAPDGRGGLTVDEGAGGDRWVISIMSGHERRGRWRIGRRCTVLNLLGGSEIDLNDAELAGPVTQLNV
jgi:uncharacterized protein DUF1707